VELLSLVLGPPPCSALLTVAIHIQQLMYATTRNREVVLGMLISKGDGTCTDDVTIPADVSELFPEMVENRRWFHMHPEFSFSEVETAAHVVEVMPYYKKRGSLYHTPLSLT